MKTIEYLSKPESVSMGDDWFTSVSIDHFWIKRRFDILFKLFKKEMTQAKSIGEVGCGSGLVQRQIEDRLKLSVDGYDLNELALKQNISQTSRAICYNIFDKHPRTNQTYDVMLLMDVIEHIENEDEFIIALSSMITPKGFLAVNVPAFQSLYSVYDKEVGHIRRYTYNQLKSVFEKHGFKPVKWSYWGLPMLPLLILRRLYLFFVKQENVVKNGMSATARPVNLGLRILSKLEIIPQKLFGSSLMIIFVKP